MVVPFPAYASAASSVVAAVAGVAYGKTGVALDASTYIGPVAETRTASGSVTERTVESARTRLAVKLYVPGPKVCVTVAPVSPSPAHVTVAPVRS